MMLLPRAHAHVSGYTDTSVQIARTGVRILYTAPADNVRELLRTRPDEAPAPLRDPAHYADAIKSGWEVSSGGRRCLLSSLQSRELQAVAAYQYQLTYVCPDGMDTLEVGYRLFFDRWPEHENFVRMFMADQRQRLRFTDDRRRVELPIANLLREWNRPLAPGFFDADPNHALASADDGDAQPTPRVITPEPRLGALDFAQLDPGFIALGVRHIFAGLDHVLFVVGLVLLATRVRQLVALVTSFTVAHAATMALSTLGTIHLDAAWTEPLIALTIVHIGVENLLALRRSTAPGGSLATRALWRRMALVFVFGLIHGVGFSYTLRDMGLGEDVLGVLLYFNLGVEAGQLGIVAATLPAVMLWRRRSWGRTLSLAVAASVAVAGVAMLATRL